MSIIWVSMMNLGMEGEYVEFKDSISELKKGLISVTAMLNRHCSAQVYFGVSENGDVIGDDVGKTTVKMIRQAAEELIDPPIIPEIEILRTEDKKRYVSVKAEADDRPYLFKGAAYMRCGNEDRRAARDELCRMLLSTRNQLRETLCSKQSLSFTQLRETLTEHGVQITDDASFFRDNGLVNQSRKFNELAELLSDQNRHVLTVTVFAGLDRTRISMRKEFNGRSIIREISSVNDYMESMNETSINVTGTDRTERQLFDQDAFREAWINACVHNDWIGRIPPTIHIFDDRMEIISYGNRPYWLTDDEFYKGKSIPINRYLKDIFVSAGLCGHGGVPAVIKSYGKNAYAFSGGRVTVTMRFFNKRNASRYRNDAPVKGLSENEMLVLCALREHPEYSLDRISELTGLARSTVGNIVPSLRKSGLVKRNGSYRNGVWAVLADF